MMSARDSQIVRLGYLLLKNEWLSWLLIALLAILPFASTLSLAVICLITLRKGWVAGAKALMVGLAAICIDMQLKGGQALLLNSAIMTYVIAYLSAGLLRQHAGWRTVAGFQILTALSGLLLVQIIFPEFSADLYQFVFDVFKSIDAQGDIVKSLSQQSEQSRENLAGYLLGIKAASLLFSASLSLMIARSAQAKMFNPGGFKREMQVFRIPPVTVMLFGVCMAGVYYSNPLMLSFFPVLFLYLVLAGISFGLLALEGKRRLVVMLGMIVPVFLVPYVALPIYVALGSIDSLFNLRQRLLPCAGDNSNKG